MVHRRNKPSAVVTQSPLGKSSQRHRHHALVQMASNTRRKQTASKTSHNRQIEFLKFLHQTKADQADFSPNYSPRL
jgi:hypothetical protein